MAADLMTFTQMAADLDIHTNGCRSHDTFNAAWYILIAVDGTTF